MKFYFILSIALIFNAGISLAQVDVNASGGDLKNQNGNVSYSVGQVFYNTKQGSDLNLSEGVQQALEISNVTSVEEISYSDKISVYPNPADGEITIELKDSDNRMLDCKIFNMKAELIMDLNINSIKTKVDLNELPAGTYLIEFTKANQKFQTFKIIKH